MKSENDATEVADVPTGTEVSEYPSNDTTTEGLTDSGRPLTVAVDDDDELEAIERQERALQERKALIEARKLQELRDKLAQIDKETIEAMKPLKDQLDVIEAEGNDRKATMIETYAAKGIELPNATQSAHKQGIVNKVVGLLRSRSGPVLSSELATACGISTQSLRNHMVSYDPSKVSFLNKAKHSSYQWIEAEDEDALD